MSAEIFAAYINNMVGLGQVLGLDEDELWAAAGVSKEVAGDPDRLIPFESLVSMWAFFIESFPGVPLGLRIARMMDYSRLGLVGQLILTSPDVRTTIERTIRFNRLFDPLLTIELEEASGFGHIRMRHTPQVQALGEPMEMLMASMCLDVRRRAGTEEGLLTVHFAHPQRHPLEVYSPIFPARVLFDQPEYGFTFETRLLDACYDDADVSAGRYIERYAHSIIQAQEPTAANPTERRVRQHLHEMIAECGHLHQDEVAKVLGMSTRTLQRRLSTEGTSFATLLGEVRRIHAMRLLEDPELAVYEVAFLLGYQESTSFYRAFKRWTGLTPEAHRRGDAL